MDNKKKLKQQYKETVKTTAGVFQIKNIKNQKIFIKSTMNLDTMNSQQFMLEQNLHTNKLLQQEWNEFGREAFTWDVLEALPHKEEELIYRKDALKKLEEKWLAQLRPYGERGYHQC